jgi:uncharacterized protein (DUF2249 family)
MDGEVDQDPQAVIAESGEAHDFSRGRLKDIQEILIIPDSRAIVKIYLIYMLSQSHHHPEESPMPFAPSTTVDVRTIIPRERHPLIFNTFRGLAPGEAFLLVNDHDPKPLYYQFKAELGEVFDWEYLESGPEVWKVRIGKPQ